MLVVDALAIALWSVLGVVGAWHLLTGRKMIFGLPRDIKEGSGLRLFGLLYLLVASFVIGEALRGSFRPEGVALTYVFVAIAIVIALYRRGQARTKVPAAPPQP